MPFKLLGMTIAKSFIDNAIFKVPIINPNLVSKSLKHNDLCLTNDSWLLEIARSVLRPHGCKSQDLSQRTSEQIFFVFPKLQLCRLKAPN